MAEQRTRTARYVLTGTEFDVLWDELRLGPTPVALRLPSPGRTHAERARIVAAARRDLRARGLADAGGPAPEPTRLLGLLAAPHRALELRARAARPVRAVAAERDGAGVLAVRRDGTVVLGDAGTPAHAVCRTLPARTAGPLRPVSLPTATLAGILTAIEGRAGVPAAVTAAIGAGPPTGSRTVGNGGSREDAELIEGLLRGATDRAQVAAVVHDRWGNPRRPVPPVTVLDSPRGRYRLTRGAAADGTEWSTLAPVDGRGLHALLTGLLEDAERS